MAQEHPHNTLNDEQLEAVTTTDGPLLVIAGPGTGKTHLLVERVRSILSTCDVTAKNILCLTYTDAATEEMRSRLVRDLGSKAYGVTVSTFHALAKGISETHPEYFRERSYRQPVTNLQSSEILDCILKHLPSDNPLSGTFKDKARNIGAMRGFISAMKRAGASPKTCKEIAQQNLAAADYLNSQAALMNLINLNLPRTGEEKAAHISSFANLITDAADNAPRELTDPVQGASGIYTPYLAWLRDIVQDDRLHTQNDVSHYTTIRDKNFKRNANDTRTATRKTDVAFATAADVYEQYQQRLDDLALIDYDDMIMDVLEVLRREPELRYELQDRYRYIMVDEFQDTNAAQLALVDLLCEGIDVPNVMAVGDDDQAIMSFQGASASHIRAFKDKYGAKTVELRKNYRSTPSIVNLALSVAKNITGRLDDNKALEAVSQQETPNPFSECVFTSTSQEYSTLVGWVKQRVDEIAANSADTEHAIGIIACKHRDLSGIAPHLAARGIPFNYDVRRDVFELDSMATPLALLRCVSALARGSSQQAESELPQILCAPEFHVDKSELLHFIARARSSRASWLDELEGTDNQTLKDLYDKLSTWAVAAPAAPVRDLMRSIMDASLAYRQERRETEPNSYAEVVGGVNGLLRFASQEMEATDGPMRLPDVVDRIVQAQRFGNKISCTIRFGGNEHVTLTTAHSAKGREFDLVIVIDADDNNWHSTWHSIDLYPSNVHVSNGAKTEDDHARLVYVALTRARQKLCISRVAGEPLREIQDAMSNGLVQTQNYDTQPIDEQTLATKVEWQAEYALNNPVYASLINDYQPRALSASTINSFIYCDANGRTSQRFFEERVLRLPRPINGSTEFGNIVHEAMRDVVVTAFGKDAKQEPDIDTAIKRVLQDHLADLRQLDLREEDVARYEARFTAIANNCVPWVRDRIAEWFQEHPNGHIETERTLNTWILCKVPFTGNVDLMLVDKSSKMIWVYDYKTGSAPRFRDKKDPHERQLQLYKALVKGSGEYEGYNVAACEDWYLEPTLDRPDEDLAEPVKCVDGNVTGDIGENNVLTSCRVAHAVWTLITQGNLMPQGFESTPGYEEAMKLDKWKRPEALSRAYADWLVDVVEGGCI